MKKVLIKINSSALGDTLLWFPYTEKYRIEHNLDQIWVNCYGLWADTFFKPVYPNHIFNSSENESSFDEVYHISWSIYTELNKITYPSFRPLQEIASAQLGFEEFEEIRPKIHIKKELNHEEFPNIVSIGIHSTAQAKYWNNPDGWRETIDYLHSKEMSVVCLDRHHTFGNGFVAMLGLIWPPGGIPLDSRRDSDHIGGLKTQI